MADLKRLEVEARDGPSDPNSLAKWRILNRLHDRNETMYYKVSLNLNAIVREGAYLKVIYPCKIVIVQNYHLH